MELRFIPEQMLRLVVCIFLMLLAPCARGGTELDPVLKQTLPGNVKIGISVEELRRLRPEIVEGPVAQVPEDSQEGQIFPIYLENIDLGTPQAAAYWYLTQNETLVGCLKIRNVSLVTSKEELGKRVAQAFSPLALAYGDPEKTVAVRGGSNGYVKLTLDRWHLPKVGSVYFLATNREITTGFIQHDSFPEGSVFLKPDPTKFPDDSFEDKQAPSVVDLARPSKDTILSVGKERSKEGLGSAEKNLGILSEPKSRLGNSSPISGKSPLLWVIISVALIIVLVLLAIRRSKRRADDA